MKTQLTVFFTLLLLQFAALTSSLAISVKDNKGRVMNVEVMSYTKSSGNVRIKRDDGNIFNIKISLFDKESQKKIEAAAPAAFPKLNINISVGKRRQKQARSTYMKSNLVTISAKIKNISRDVDMAKCRFTIFLIGRNSKRYADRSMDWSKILSIQKFDTALTAGKEYSHELDPIATAYDSDKDSTNVGGWDFDGYLHVIQDPDGQIIMGKSSIGPLKTSAVNNPQLLKQALEFKQGLQLNRDFTPL